MAESWSWVHRRANDLSKKNRKQSEWTEASFEEKNAELRELKCKFCSQSRVLKKELWPAWSKRCNVCRKINHWKSSEVCAMKEKIRSVNKDSDYVTRIRMWPLWRLSTPLLMVLPQRKTNQSIVKCVSGLTQSDLQVTVEPLLASSPEVTSVTPSLSHLTFPYQWITGLS